MKRSVILARRRLLRGAGGFTLALPLLESLAVPARSFGAPVSFPRAPRFVAFTTEHGGIDGASMYPDSATLTDTAPIVPGHAAKHGALVRRLDGADAVLSSVLRAPATRLTARLVAKMNVLRGLDIPFYIAHHTGGHLGNYARNDGNGQDGKELQKHPSPTIDQVMAWSRSFYRDLSGVKERAIITGSRGGFSWTWSNPAGRTGAIQEVRREESSLALFQKIFVAPPAPSENPGAPVVDRVFESYRRLRDGNRRLGAADRQRLEDHMQALAELQRRLTAARPVGCGEVSRPALDSRTLGYTYHDPDRSRQRFQLYNDVIQAAFRCGSTRIAVVSVGDTFSRFSGDWHQDIAHKHTLPGPQATLVTALRQTFADVILDLAAKLDVEETPGTTLLDNTLMQWTQESGQNTHDSPSIPVITFGGAAGALRTGRFVDYRNQVPGSRMMLGMLSEYTGLTYNRWLATVLQVMGIPRAEFETPGVPGYGHPFVSPSYRARYVSGVVESAGELAPVVS